MNSSFISITGGSGVNGDKLYVNDDLKVYAISDGASGSYDKVKAAELSLSYFTDLKFNHLNDPKIEIEKAINYANKKLMELSWEHNCLSFATLIIVIAKGEEIYYGGVGDSNIYLVDFKNVKSIYSPVKKYQNAVDHKVITKKECEEAIAKLPSVLISEYDYFIPSVIPRFEVKTTKLKESEQLVICTDGVSDWMNEKDWINLIMTNNDNKIDSIIKLVSARCPEDRNDDKSMIILKRIG